MTRPTAKRTCPTPGKRRYRDRVAALLALASTGGKHTRRGKDERRAYRCRCGGWHLTARPGGAS